MSHVHINEIIFGCSPDEQEAWYVCPAHRYETSEQNQVESKYSPRLRGESIAHINCVAKQKRTGQI